MCEWLGSNLLRYFSRLLSLKNENVLNNNKKKKGREKPKGIDMTQRNFIIISFSPFFYCTRISFWWPFFPSFFYFSNFIYEKEATHMYVRFGLCYLRHTHLGNQSPRETTTRTTNWIKLYRTHTGSFFCFSHNRSRLVCSAKRSASG